MSNDHILSRRAFTVESVLAILATATITITGCDGGSDLSPSPPAGAREGVVSNNHGHRAIVDAAQLNSTSTITIAQPRAGAYSVGTCVDFRERTRRKNLVHHRGPQPHGDL